MKGETKSWEGSLNKYGNEQWVTDMWQRVILETVHKRSGSHMTTTMSPKCGSHGEKETQCSGLPRSSAPQKRQSLYPLCAVAQRQAGRDNKSSLGGTIVASRVLLGTSSKGEDGGN